MILTTICYLKKDNQTLLLFRNKKNRDINKGKWIGVGGKIEKNETPHQCIIREVKEETGLSVSSLVYHGFVMFPGIYYGEDEGMYVFSSSDFTGDLKEVCDEGHLEWVDNENMFSLPMWKGDYYFLKWIYDYDKHYASITYDDHGDVIELKEELINENSDYWL